MGLRELKKEQTRQLIADTAWQLFADRGFDKVSVAEVARAAQVAEVLKRQGVELIVIDLVGYDIHIDGSFQMIDKDLALIDPTGLPYSFLERLKALGVRSVEIEPADDKWIVNSLAVAPGKIIMPEGATNRTLDALAKHGVSWTTIPYGKMQLNGGGIHCSTTPLIRDPL